MQAIVNLINWIRMFLGKMKRDRVDAYSAQSAFYVLMSFIPFVMLMLTMIQYTPLTKDDMMEVLMSVLPESFVDLMDSVLNSIYTKSTALISGTVIAAVWACGRSVLAITNGLNSIFGLEETRNYVIMRLRSAAYILGLLVSFIVAMALLVFGNQIHDVILNHAPFLKNFSVVLINVRTIATLMLLTVIFTGMFMVLPNEKRNFFTQIPGAAASAIAWSVFSYGFSIYINYSKNLSAIYGGLATLIMIMLWLYFCMWLLFLGAEINCYLETPESFA